MISGLQEVLVIVIVFLFIILFTRLSNRNSATLKKLELKWKARLYVVISILWPITFAIYNKICGNSCLFFISFGIGPIVLFWSVFWIKAGK